jgi:hypothetical protein
MYLSFLGSYFWFLRLTLKSADSFEAAFLFLCPQSRGLNSLPPMQPPPPDALPYSSSGFLFVSTRKWLTKPYFSKANIRSKPAQTQIQARS